MIILLPGYVYGQAGSSTKSQYAHPDPDNSGHRHMHAHMTKPARFPAVMLSLAGCVACTIYECSRPLQVHFRQATWKGHPKAQSARPAHVQAVGSMLPTESGRPRHLLLHAGCLLKKRSWPIIITYATEDPLSFMPHCLSTATSQWLTSAGGGTPSLNFSMVPTLLPGLFHSISALASWLGAPIIP
eukprot:967670-Pelagomonas_calceolata.AAC.1